MSSPRSAGIRDDDRAGGAQLVAAAACLVSFPAPPVLEAEPSFFDPPSEPPASDPELGEPDAVVDSLFFPDPLPLAAARESVL